MARKHRKHSRKHRKLSNPFHKRRSHRRRYHRNPGIGMPKMSGVMGDLAVALIAGGGAYLIARSGEKFLGKLIPSMVPAQMRAPLANGLLAVLGIVASEAMLKGKPHAKVAAEAGLSIPLVESLINMTPLGLALGTQRVLMLPAAPAASAAGGMSAALSASLDAALDEPYENEY
jgi:hypothetical protein